MLLRKAYLKWAYKKTTRFATVMQHTISSITTVAKWGFTPETEFEALHNLTSEWMFKVQRLTEVP